MTFFEYDKKPDVLIIHLDEIKNSLETIDYELSFGSILFKIDPETGKLIQILIYDYSKIKWKLIYNLMFPYIGGILNRLYNKIFLILYRF